MVRVSGGSYMFVVALFCCLMRDSTLIYTSLLIRLQWRMLKVALLSVSSG